MFWLGSGGDPDRAPAPIVPRYCEPEFRGCAERGDRFRRRLHTAFFAGCLAIFAVWSVVQ